MCDSAGNAIAPPSCGAPTSRGGACRCRASALAPDGTPRCRRHAGEIEECAICLDPLTPGRRRADTPCGHAFHSKCLRAWFRRQPLTCPLCRRECLECLPLAGAGLGARLQAMLRTVPPDPNAFFPAYMRGLLEREAVATGLGGGPGIDLLVDIACECFTRQNFFATVRALGL